MNTITKSTVYMVLKGSTGHAHNACIADKAKHDHESLSQDFIYPITRITLSKLKINTPHDHENYHFTNTTPLL